MDERRRRAGLNEAIFREVNEQIEHLNDRFGAVRSELLQIVCECGNLDCARQLSLPAAVYEEVRADPETFMVEPGHEDPAVEDVVRRGDGYLVVKKQPGGPAELARETDPRS